MTDVEIDALLQSWVRDPSTFTADQTERLIKFFVAWRRGLKYDAALHAQALEQLLKN